MNDLLMLMSPSRSALVEHLKRAGSATAQEAAEALGLGLTTVRQHLDALIEMGLVDHRSVIEGPGRPTLHYRLTAEGRRLFPTHEAALLTDLVAYLLREGHLAVVEAFFRQAWADRRARLDAALRAAGAETLEERLVVVHGFLTAEGFAPEVVSAGTSVTLRECNCPLAGAVAATRLPCRLEAELLAHALGRPLARVSYVPDGEPVCAYELDATPR